MARGAFPPALVTARFLIPTARASAPTTPAFARTTVNPMPRPCLDTDHVTARTTVWFEVVVLVGNLPLGELDPWSLSATLSSSGGSDRG